MSNLLPSLFWYSTLTLIILLTSGSCASQGPVEWSLFSLILHQNNSGETGLGRGIPRFSKPRWRKQRRKPSLSCRLTATRYHSNTAILGPSSPSRVPDIEAYAFDRRRFVLISSFKQ